MLTPNALPLSLYVHMPWCLHKCPYCDFNSHALKGELPEARYVAALCQELEHKQAWLGGRCVQTIFIGGGTPSLFSAAAYATLLNWLDQRNLLAPECEITLEANPGASEQARFTAYRAAGINRLSLGIQSFSDEQLRALGRIHDSQQAARAIEMAKAAGFARFNLDLMFGLPKQSLEAALEDLHLACAHAPPHVSWYQLTLEPNTYFHRFPPVLPNDDDLWTMQQAGIAYLATQGLARYEVSAFAKDHGVARHNMNYWTFGDYLGIGAGAHSKITHHDGSLVRSQNHKHPTRYLANPRESAEQTTISPSTLPFEFMLNSLRLFQPLELSLFETRTGLPRAILQEPIQRGLEAGLLTCDATHLTLTILGHDFLNDVIELFLPK